MLVGVFSPIQSYIVLDILGAGDCGGVILWYRASV